MFKLVKNKKETNFIAVNSLSAHVSVRNQIMQFMQWMQCKQYACALKEDLQVYWGINKIKTAFTFTVFFLLNNVLFANVIKAIDFHKYYGIFVCFFYAPGFGKISEHNITKQANHMSLKLAHVSKQVIWLHHTVFLADCSKYFRIIFVCEITHTHKQTFIYFIHFSLTYNFAHKNHRNWISYS